MLPFNGVNCLIASIYLAIIMGLIGLILLLTKKKKNNLPRNLGVVMLSISIVLVTFVHGIYSKNVRHSQLVNIEPLTNLSTESDIKTIKDVFNQNNTPYSFNIIISDGINEKTGLKSDTIREFVEATYEKESSIIVGIRLFNSTKDASNEYQFEYSQRGVKDFGILESKNFEAYKYFITFTNQTRTDPEGGNVLSDIYLSYVAYQKNNMLITIYETSHNKDDKDKDRIIRDIAEMISGLSGTGNLTY